MPTRTTEWLDSVQEYVEDFGEDMPETNVDRQLFKVLGALGSDVKHVLSIQERSRQDAAQLRMDMRQDTAEVKNELKNAIENMQKAHAALDKRVSAIEAWQTKMMAYMTILIPVAITVGNYVLPIILGAF